MLYRIISISLGVFILLLGFYVLMTSSNEKPYIKVLGIIMSLTGGLYLLLSLFIAIFD